MSFYHGRTSLPQRFRLVQLSALEADGLPFSTVLSEEEIQDAFDEQDVSFAQEEDDVYTPPLTLWAFLSQVLHKGEQRSCLAVFDPLPRPALDEATGCRPARGCSSRSPR